MLKQFKIPPILDEKAEWVEIISERGSGLIIRCTKEESIRLARTILYTYGIKDN